MDISNGEKEGSVFKDVVGTETYMPTNQVGVLLEANDNISKCDSRISI